MEAEIAEAEEALKNFQNVRQEIEEQAQKVLDEVKTLTVSSSTIYFLPAGALVKHFISN